MADEKDFREPDGATQDYELDEVFELAFEIDAFLRAHNLKYRTKFPMEQRQREILADKMLESDTFYIKHLISSVLGHEGDALMNRLNAYETEFRKNQYSVYHLKSDYDKKCGYSLKSEREKGNYINKDMYEIVRSEPLNSEDTYNMAMELMDDRRRTQFLDNGESDFSYEIENVCRFRVNVFKQSNCVAAALRLISNNIPSFEDLRLPEVISDLAMLPRGLVLVTGPTGSGKSTTLAAVINKINKHRKDHVITLEDPIEYKHNHINSIINQREVGSDTKSFANGLRAALREDPDVILVGEMRDTETIATAITAAETGHLVLATLHTQDAASTVNRIIDVFPEHQQQQIRIQLAGNLQGIVAQQLLMNREQTGRLAAFEILVATPALRNLIREGKTHQIPSYIQTGSKFGMICMDAYLAQLVRQNKIDRSVAEERCYDPLTLERYMHGL